MAHILVTEGVTPLFFKVTLRISTIQNKETVVR